MSQILNQSVRVSFLIKDIIKDYLHAHDWKHFDTLTDAVLSRRQEYFAGRVCAAIAYNKLTGKMLSELNNLSDRQPDWPSDVIGSISHNEKYVVAELILKNSNPILGIGVDVATLGSVSQSLQNQICTQGEYENLSLLSIENLLTYIFSFKESLFKAVYPLTLDFFDFQAAQVIEINLDQKTFKIKLDESVFQKLPLVLKTRTHFTEKIFSGNFDFLDQRTLITRLTLM